MRGFRFHGTAKRDAVHAIHLGRVSRDDGDGVNLPSGFVTREERSVCARCRVEQTLETV